jgi:hypothetical protein
MLQSGFVDEGFCCSVVMLDKAEAFLGVEELDSSG